MAESSRNDTREKETLVFEPDIATRETAALSAFPDSLTRTDLSEIRTTLHGATDDAQLDRRLRQYQSSHLHQDERPRYSLGNRIGTGGQGRVYVLRDADCHRDCALKVLRTTDPRPEQISRFVREAQITAQLEHPGIIPVYDIGVLEDGIVYYTMKRIEGQPLNEVLLDQAGRGAHRYELLQILLRVCDAVAYAHARGIVHRDLKPANIMVARYGEVLLLDWGLCKITDDADADAMMVDSGEASTPLENPVMTRQGSTLGTPMYMSPEQASGHNHLVDGRSDVYSLGVILYEILVGRSPYHPAIEVHSVMEAIALGRWNAPDPAVGPLPRPLVGILDKAMALRRRDRYQTVEAFAVDLRAFLAGAAVSAYRESIMERVTRVLRRHRKAAVGAAVATGVLLLGGAILWIGVAIVEANRLDVLQLQADAAELRHELHEALQSYRQLDTLRPGTPAYIRKIEQLQTAEFDQETRRANATRARDCLAAARVLLAGGDPDTLGDCQLKLREGLALLADDTSAEDLRRDVFDALREVDRALDSAGERLRLQRVAGQLQRARECAERGDLVGARVAYSRAMEESATTDATRQVLTFIETGEEAARTRQRQADARTLLTEADVLLGAQDWDGAIRKLQGSLALHPLEEVEGRMRKAVTGINQREEAKRLADVRREQDAAIAAHAAALTNEASAEVARCLDCIAVLQKENPELVADFDLATAREGLAALRQRQHQVEAQKILGAIDGRLVVMRDLHHQLIGTERALAVLHNDVESLSTPEATRKERQLNADQVGLQRELNLAAEAVVTDLLRCQDLCPDEPMVRRRFADYWAFRVKDAEDRSLPAEVAAHAAMGQQYDQGDHADLFAGQTKVQNVGDAPCRLERLVTDADGCLRGCGEILVVEPAVTVTVTTDRYLLRGVEGTVTTLRLRRGEPQELIAPVIPVVPAGIDFLAHVPGGSVAQRNPITGEPLMETARVAGFFLARHEVTAGEYLTFLNDPIVRAEIDAVRGAAQQARLILAPRASYWTVDSLWDEVDGRFVLRYRDGKVIDPGLPVTYINAQDVSRYLAWRTARDRLAWRLPSEVEWQLAITGGDGRNFPWGDHPNPALCYSHPRAVEDGGRIGRPTGSFPADVSVQGVRDLAGSVAEFVTPVWTRVDEQFALLCGGSFTDRDAYRFAAYGRRLIDERIPRSSIGFRLALSAP